MPVGNPRDICPLSITNNYCGMGRSLEVRRKSENLPVVGSTLIRDPIPHQLDVSLSSIGAGRNGYLSVLASWNASAALRPDADLSAVVWFGLNEENRRSSRGDGGFFIGV